MVITSSLLGPEGQTSSSIEDAGIAASTALYRGKEQDGHGHTVFLLRTRRADLLFPRRYATITSTDLYCGMEEDDHGQHPLLLRTRRADLLFSRRYAMTTSTALLLGKEEGCHGHPSSS